MTRNLRPHSFFALLLALAWLPGCETRTAAQATPAVGLSQTTPTAPAPPPALAPPVAPRIPHVSTIHGLERPDDYFWLREKDTPPVLAYLRAENAYTDSMTGAQAPLRKKLYDEMIGRIAQTDTSAPYLDHGYYYYSRTEEGKEQAIYCRKKGNLDAAEEVLLDLNALRGTQKFLGLGGTSVSDDGNLLAYATDATGFRVYTLHVKDLRTGKELREAIERVTSFAWAADGKTLFYVTEDDAKRPYRLYRHRLCEDPAVDALIWEEKDERFVARVSRSRSDAYLFLNLRSHTTSEARWIPANKPAASWKVVAPREQNLEYYVDHAGDRFYIRTNDRGRTFRLVSAPVANPSRKNWKEVIAQRDDVMLEGVDLFKDHYVTFTRSGALPHLEVHRYGRAGAEEIAFDEAVYSVSPDNNADFATKNYRFAFASLRTPFSVYDYDVATKQRVLRKRQPVLGGFDPSAYTSERIYARADDGASIPISLVYKKGVNRDGRAPLLLTGYGAYGFSLPVRFDSDRLSLLDRGVVIAQAHIRGGGDLGKRWHDEGRMMAKRNTFTDFIACAEHLVKEQYTSPQKLAIEGASAGGLLIGAVLNMRPELFRAAIADVPFVDVVNTMLDESLPLTVGEFEEWGNPKERAAYDYMMTYSPYDNVAAQRYPSILVESAYNDSQVMYFEPAKWVARLRSRKTDANPLLLRMDLEPAGHGGKSGRYEQREQTAFEYAFLLTQLGVAAQ